MKYLRCAVAATATADNALSAEQHVLCERKLTHHAGQIESNYDETTDSFDNMNLKAELLRGVYAYGFERPSAIQQRAIMPVIKGELNSRSQDCTTSD